MVLDPGPIFVVTAAPVRPPALRMAEPGVLAGAENAALVRTWNILAGCCATPTKAGPGAFRSNTPGGSVMRFGSAPAVCLIKRLAGFGFGAISSGGNIVIVAVKVACTGIGASPISSCAPP